MARLGTVVSTDHASTLLFLPLAHVFARLVQVLAFTAGARLGHTADVKQAMPDLAEFRPTFILAVPRVFEKIYNASEARSDGEGRGKAFRYAAQVAEQWSRAQQDGGAGVVLKAKHAAFDKLVYARIREAMGGRIEYCVSGGAPLGERLGHFFHGAGITVLEGYGLTETTAPATVNTPDSLRIGTVGPPLPGVSIRVDDTGEVLVRGHNVMAGYWNNPEASAEVLDDGWFRTGDLGELDADGFLRITGRRKEILVTAGGKNVAPAVLEDRIRANTIVSQCIVVGDARPYVAALVTLDDEMLPAWLKHQGKAQMSVEEAAGDEDVQREVQRAVDDANDQVSKAESIRRFRILPVDFTEQGGYVTPSLKLKRGVVMKDFAAEVEEPLPLTRPAETPTAGR
ncbi:hypothetical protein GCM10025868_43490 [Angustibacter aerolatus]|uniref:Acyl-CoA synthetase n=1 Tax=Angustibacter aerolatus TaxID=1162965 RepID=A0ABQ6JMG3_9ACTN|nr:AMP-dependent synthetase/ligase [Angustibacter aerolatus]GMA89099.1 hypothetical protein GCM10025868_43490 [Angustibacter aerolatus]